MTKPHAHWTVLPHGPLTEVAPHLFTVTGQLKMPLGETTRRMTVVQLGDEHGDSLAIYSAIALDETEMAKLEGLGTPRYLLVPSEIHRLDVKAWKERFPDLVVIAPRGARDKVSEVVPVTTTDVELPDDRVQLVIVPGTGDRELAMIVDTGAGKTLVVNDLIFNLPRVPGLAGFGLRLLGFHPGAPSMPKPVVRKLVQNKPALRAQLERWATLAGLERILPSHGEVIERPQQTLARLAAAL